MYRVKQETLKKHRFFNANRNSLKCAFLHTLMVKTGRGLDFFWAVYLPFEKIPDTSIMNSNLIFFCNALGGYLIRFYYDFNCKPEFINMFNRK